MPNKKKFIDKKHATTFHLVHRSQRDPLQGSDAPQRVLLPVGAPYNSNKEDRLEEQHKYGIYYDDDYDYMQHLRTADEIRQVGTGEGFRIVNNIGGSSKPSVQLPASVFASVEETDVGMLSRGTVTGPQPDWDPDIVAALDDDFNMDDPANMLDDDFVMKANASGGEEEDDDDEDISPHHEDTMTRYFRTLAVGNSVDAGQSKREVNQVKKGKNKEESESGEEGSDDEWETDDGSENDDEDVNDFDDPNEMFADEETKSRFTEYSMSSSVLPRNKGLRQLDDHFEKLYEQYDENEIGALDDEDTLGLDTQRNKLLLADALKEFEKYREVKTLKDVVELQVDAVGSSEEESSSDEEVMVVETDDKEKWDCESILSTYSNIYNHPKLIEEPGKITLTKRAGIPAGILHQKDASTKQIEIEKRKAERKEKLSQSLRKPDETLEEKKARKKLVKEQRQVRRQEKKITKLTFKSEQIKQQTDNVQTQRNVPAVKLA